MLANIILIFIAILFILFVWVLWLRHSVSQILHDTGHKADLLKAEMWTRRDMVPFLLESFRAEQEPNADWQELLAGRAHFNKTGSIKDELEFGIMLKNFIEKNKLHSINFLEAKKDIEDITIIIQEKEKDFDTAVSTYNEKLKQFPYSLASVIFGFQVLET